jgi:hypothetical protein
MFCVPTWQPQLPVLVAFAAGLSHALDSPSSKFQIVPSQTNDLHKLLRAAEFTSACRLPMSALSNFATASVLVSLSPWWVFLLGLDSPSSNTCSSTICPADFSLTNLQLHKSALPIYPNIGMAASTLRHYFGQPAEVCTSCTFDTVTNHPHQKNLMPSSDRFEVPLHRICSSQSMFLLPTKPLALPTFNNNSVHRISSTCFKTELWHHSVWPVSFPQMSNISYSQACFHEVRTLLTSILGIHPSSQNTHAKSLWRITWAPIRTSNSPTILRPKNCKYKI